MLVSGFPVRGYLSATTPMLVALCSCGVARSAEIRLPSGNHLVRSFKHLYPMEVGETIIDTECDTNDPSNQSQIPPPTHPTPPVFAVSAALRSTPGSSNKMVTSDGGTTNVKVGTGAPDVSTTVRSPQMIKTPEGVTTSGGPGGQVMVQSPDGGTKSGPSDAGYGSQDVTGIPGRLGGHPGGSTASSVSDANCQHSVMRDGRAVTRRAAASHALNKHSQPSKHGIVARLMMSFMTVIDPTSQWFNPCLWCFMMCI